MDEWQKEPEPSMFSEERESPEWKTLRSNVHKTQLFYGYAAEEKTSRILNWDTPGSGFLFIIPKEPEKLFIIPGMCDRCVIFAVVQYACKPKVND